MEDCPIRHDFKDRFHRYTTLFLSKALPESLEAPLEEELVDTPSEEEVEDASLEEQLVDAPSLEELALVDTTLTLIPCGIKAERRLPSVVPSASSSSEVLIPGVD